MAKDFDIFNGGIKNMREYVEEQKNNLKVYEEQMLEQAQNNLLDNIKVNSNNITASGVGMDSDGIRELEYTAQEVANSNEIEKVSSRHIKIRNTSEEATYAEFGTGIIGKGTPYPNNALQWEYDVNSHGERGWRYIGRSGKLVRTQGYPAYATYYNSFEDLKKDLDSISKETFKGVFTNED